MERGGKVEAVYFKTILKILFVFGVPIMEPIKLTGVFGKLYKIYSWAVLSIFCWAYALLEIIQLFTGYTDITSFGNNIAHVFQHVLGSAKVALILYFKREIWDYLKQLETGECKPDFKRGGQKEFDLIKSAISFTHMHMMMFHGIVVVIFSSLGVFNYNFNFPRGNLTEPASKILPLNTWFPFDLTKTNLYVVGFAYQYYSILHLAIYISSSDVLCCGIMIHMKAQYIILKNSLRSLVERSKSGNREEFSGRAWNNIRRCIRHHQKILKLSQQAEDAFNYLMLFQSLSSLMMICLSLFQLSVTKLLSLAFVSMFSFLMLMVFQVFIFCYCGEQVLIQTETLSFAIYESDWLALNNGQKKILLQMMMRAQRPFRFTAGKFVFLSMETFMKIVKGSASYFTVLQSLNF